jgi:hypothetical protein
MTTSRWAAVADALVSTMGATTGFRLPGADADETLTIVFDGPEWQISGDTGATFLVVGGTIEDDAQGNAEQEWATIGGRARDERGEVTCNAVAQLGLLNLSDASLDASASQDTWRSLRATAFAIVASVELALRTDPSLGITNVPYMIAEIGTDTTVRQYMTETGSVVSIAFSVKYKTRI